MIQSKMFKKISVAFSALLMAGTLVACGGDEDSNNTSACADGQVEVGAGSSIAAGCYDTCADGTACADGKTCKTYPGGQKLCVTDTATNNTNNTNNDTCDTGKVKVSYEGSEQCMTDCATDASVCGATEECTSVGSNKVCTPAEQPACGDGEVETVYAGGTKSCFKTCTSNTDCTDGKSCKTDDAGTNMVCVQPGAVAQLCESYCDILFGSCVESTCAGLDATEKQNILATKELCLNGGTVQGQTIAGCEQRLGSNATEKATAEKLVQNGCASPVAKVELCSNFGAQECGCSPADYSKGCTSDAECAGGTVAGTCAQESNEQAGNPPGGLCVVNGCHQYLDAVPTSTDLEWSAQNEKIALVCGEQSACVTFVQQGQIGSVCQEACTATSDCARAVTGDSDSGYVCAPGPFYFVAMQGSSELSARQGSCLPACAQDSDCAQGEVCGSSRFCEATCDPALATACVENGIKLANCVESTKTPGTFSCHPDESIYTDGGCKLDSECGFRDSQNNEYAGVCSAGRSCELSCTPGSADRGDAFCAGAFSGTTCKVGKNSAGEDKPFCQ